MFAYYELQRRINCNKMLANTKHIRRLSDYKDIKITTITRYALRKNA